MFPALRHGDRVVVRPLQKGELPIRGYVIVCVGNGARVQQYNTTEEIQKSRLVLHRLVEIQDDGSGNILLITRGDSMINIMNHGLGSNAGECCKL